MHKRLYRVPASPVYPCSTGPALWSLILYRGLIHRRSYRVSEAILVHPCKTYVMEFILCCDWHTEHLTAYLCRTYTISLSCTVVWYSEYLTGNLSPVQFILDILYRPYLWSLSYIVVDTRKTSWGIWGHYSTPLQDLHYGVYPIPWFDTRKILPCIWGQSSTSVQDLHYGVDNKEDFCDVAEPRSSIWVYPWRMHVMEFIPYRGFTHGRSYRVSDASPVHPSGTYIMEFILYCDLTYGRSYWVFEASAVHPCIAYIKEFILCRGLTHERSYRVSEDNPVHPCKTYIMDFILHRSWHTEDLTGYLRPVLYTLVGPTLWNLAYAVVWHK